MKTSINLRRPEVKAGTWILLLALITLAAPSSRSQSSDGVSSSSLLCTLRAVDGESRTIVVLTGVGHSIRAVSMQVAPTCRVEMSRQLVDLSDLRIGQVVRVQYAMAPSRDAAARETALSIEVMTEGKGGQR